nr:unnamed protein product [Spirometra erinaceieuropaei]
MIRVLIQDCHLRLRKYKAAIEDEQAKCSRILGEPLTNDLHRSIFLSARRIRDARESKLKQKLTTLSEKNASLCYDNVVHNLSSKQLTAEQIKVLSHDACFNTTDAQPVDFIAAAESVILEAPITEENRNLLRQRISSRHMSYKKLNMLSKAENEALRTLKADKSIVILPADKGRSTVVLNKEDYVNKFLAEMLSGQPTLRSSHINGRLANAHFLPACNPSDNSRRRLSRESSRPPQLAVPEDSDLESQLSEVVTAIPNGVPGPPEMPTASPTAAAAATSILVRPSNDQTPHCGRSSSPPTETRNSATSSSTTNTALTITAEPKPSAALGGTGAASSRVSLRSRSSACTLPSGACPDHGGGGGGTLPLPTRSSGPGPSPRHTVPLSANASLAGAAAAAAASLSSRRILCTVTLLDDQVIELWMKKSATGADLFSLVSQSLGLRELNYFGLWYLRGAPIGGAAGAQTVRRKSLTLATLHASSERYQSLRSSTLGGAGPRSYDGGGGGTPSRSPGSFRGSLLRHFSLQGTADSSASEAIFHTGVPFWVNMEKKLVHQCKKTEMRFFFGVRIYPPDPCHELRDEFSRFLLCLQLRRDLVSGRLACSFYTHALLSSYWVQSELGDADLYRSSSSAAAATTTTGGAAAPTAYLSGLPLAAPLPSFDPNAWSHTGLDWTRLAPPLSERAWLRSTAGPPYPPPAVHLTPEFLRLVALFHRQLRGLVASRADLLFLQTAQKLASYGVELHRVQAVPDSCPSLLKLRPASALQADPVRCSPPDLSSTSTFSRSGFCRRSLQQHRPPQTASPPSSSAFQRSLSLAFRASSTPFSVQDPVSGSPTVCDSQSPFPLLLGVFHGGLYLFSGRLRIECFPWASILKMAYRRRSFRLFLRVPDSQTADAVRDVKFTCSTTALAKRLYRSCVEHHAFFRLRGPVRTSCEPFPFPTDTRLIRLHLGGVRSFSGSVSRVGTLPLNSQAPSSGPCLNHSRPFSEPDIRADSEVTADSHRRQGFRFANGFFRRLFRMLNLSSSASCDISTAEPRPGHLAPVPLFERDNREAFITSSTPFQIRSLSSDASETGADTGQNALGDFSLATASGVTGPSSQMSSCSLVASKASQLPFFYPEWNRPPLTGPLWRLSPTDISPGLTVDAETGCSVERDWRYFSRPSVDASSAAWRGCRATWGVKPAAVPAPADTRSGSCDNPIGVMRRHLFFEVELLGDGPVRVGWSTENANLVLGSDAFGLAYLSRLEGPVQSADFCNGLPSNSPPPPNGRLSFGALLIGGNSEMLVESAGHGDVIGCHLDLDRSITYWTRNGQPLRTGSAETQTPLLSFAHLPSGVSLYPACSIRTSSVLFNFGDTPFAFGPRPHPATSTSTPWLPLSSLGMVARVASEPAIDGLLSLSPHLASYGLTLCPNPRSVWCLDASSATGGLLMSADRFVARALLHSGWQTCKANSSIPLTRPPSPPRSDASTLPAMKAPDVYFEVRLLESLNVPEAGLRLGFAAEQADASASSSPALLGTNALSFGICADQCGLAGTFVIHEGIIRPYGKALKQGDVVGCLLNSHNGLVFWTVNGERLGHVLQLVPRANQEDAHCDGQAGNTLNDDIIHLPASILSLSPAISMRNTSVEVNFGDGPSSLRFIDKHVNVIPISTYHRTAAGRLHGQPLSTLVSNSGASLLPRHHSALERGAFRATINGFARGPSAGRGRSAFQLLRKSASAVSAPATSGREPAESRVTHAASRPDPAVVWDRRQLGRYMFSRALLDVSDPVGYYAS